MLKTCPSTLHSCVNKLIKIHHKNTQTVYLSGRESNQMWLYSPLWVMQDPGEFCIIQFAKKQVPFYCDILTYSSLFLSLLLEDSFGDFTLLMAGNLLSSSLDGLTFNLYPLSGNLNNFFPFLVFALPFFPLPLMYL